MLFFEAFFSCIWLIISTIAVLSLINDFFEALKYLYGELKYLYENLFEIGIFVIITIVLSIVILLIKDKFFRNRSFAKYKYPKTLRTTNNEFEGNLEKVREWSKRNHC